MEDMDEVFMQGAAKKESAATIEIKDRSKAIAGQCYFKNKYPL